MSRWIFLLAAAAGIALGQQPFTAADTLAIRTITEVRPSPDGKTILFSVETADLASNRNVTQLMRIAATGGEPTSVKGAPEGA